MAQEPNQNQLDIKNPHDLLFKRSFRIKKVMEDFLRGRLATDLLQQVDLTTLQLENSSFVEEKMRESTSDLVYSLKIQGQSGYMYVLMEAQSTYDELLHVRLLEYNAKLMRQHVEQGKGTKLPAIINVVLYTGTKPYKEGDGLIEYFEDPALFYQMMERPFLIPLNKNSAGQILGDGDAALTELLLKQGKQREFCKFIEEYGGEIQLLVYHSSYRVTALLYMCAMDEHLPAEILEKFPNLAEETKQEVMSGLERIINEKSRQSLQQGMQQGMQQATRNLIQGMSSAGIPFARIQEIAKLPESEIKEILGMDGKGKKKS